jgi:GR25 family glycosyltransferase involved in LPS biosynthesis
VNSVPLSELAKAELQQLETTGFRTKHYQLTKGAIGCYLSHVKIWENVLKNNYETVLIFEDDAKVPPDLNDKMHEELKNIPNDWDIVLFGYICKKCMKYEKYMVVERFMLTHCYIIKKSAIIKIMNSNTLFPITQQIDSLMSELSSILNIYSVKDKLVKQFSSRTDVQAPLINREQRKYLRINVDDRIKVL